MIKEKRLPWQLFFAYSILAIVFLDLFTLIAPLRGKDLYDSYGLFIIFSSAAIFFYNEKFSCCVEIKLFLAYAVWVLISRWLNRDFYLLADFPVVVRILYSFLLFAVGSKLERSQRERLLDCFSLIYIAFFLFTSLAGIFVILTDTYIHLPPENTWITLITAENMNSLNLLSSHRLISAARVYTAWALLIYQFFKRRSLPARILIAFCTLILHLTIPLFHSRSIQFVLSGCFGMLVMLIFREYVPGMKKASRALPLSLVSICAIVFCFCSFRWINSFFTDMRALTAPRFAVFYDSLEEKPDPEYFGISLSERDHLPFWEYKARAEQPFFPFGSRDIPADETFSAPAHFSSKQDNAVCSELIQNGYMPGTAFLPLSAQSEVAFSDERDVLQNRTLSERTYIWKSAFIAVRQNPSIALFGSLENNIMPLVNKILQEQVNPSVAEHKPHMHNMFMQCLMLTGIPGLLLLLMWTLVMVKELIGIFFCDSRSIPIAEKSLTILIAGFLVFNLTEVAIFSMLDICGECFFIVAGIVSANYYDRFPEALKPKKLRVRPEAVQESSHNRRAKTAPGAL